MLYKGKLRLNPITHIREVWDGKCWIPDNGKKLQKKPTVAFVVGIVPAVFFLLMGSILTFIDPMGDIWSFTWLICPATVIALIVFALLWYVARKGESLYYFWISLVSTLIIILILFVLSFILIGPYLGFFGCLFLLPSCIVVYSFIRTYVGS